MGERAGGVDRGAVGEVGEDTRDREGEDREGGGGGEVEGYDCEEVGGEGEGCCGEAVR